MGRISIGVPGLDKMLHGGLIPGRIYLVKGGPGMGKTTLSMHFLMEGVRKGEGALYITMEEPAAHIKTDMGKFGFNVEHPNLKIIDATPTGTKTNILGDIRYMEFGISFDKLIAGIKDILKEERYTRIVIDPITMVRVILNNEAAYRKTFLLFVNTLISNDATIILTMESDEVGVEEYLANGVIELFKFVERGKVLRGIGISKFRGSSFDEEIRPYRITNRGVEVYHNESLFMGEEY
ncbi:ATPase domain-containing protein [Thermococcus sp.]|uniref:RAD55 family ATPase n=1 Tax=Thermococcus sp. TaxID=35749 RepID=UPI0026223FAD|nr:ATPase domain-containing protein [Thermococcus sp.]